jgi:hypothetical protein
LPSKGRSENQKKWLVTSKKVLAVWGEVARVEIPLSSAKPEQPEEGLKVLDMSVVDPRWPQEQDSDHERNDGCVQENVP